jgi:hypothetical protein
MSTTTNTDEPIALDFSASPGALDLDCRDLQGTDTPQGAIVGSGFDDQLWCATRGGLLDGGEGADTLHGASVYQYDGLSDFGSAVSAPDAVTAAVAAGSEVVRGGHWDELHGFGRHGRIDLSRIDADTTADGDQAFTWIGREKFSGVAGELRYARDDAGDALVMGDVDGDGHADFALWVMGRKYLYAENFTL